MFMPENDKLSENFKLLLKVIQTWYTLTKHKHPYPKLLVINLCLWLIYKMQLFKLKVIRVPAEYHDKKAAESLEEHSNFIGDPKACALIHCDTFDLFGRRNWLCLKTEAQKGPTIIQCIPHKNVQPNVLLVKEDTFFNITSSFGMEMYGDYFHCHAYPVSNTIVVDLASSIKVSSILTPTEWTTEDEAEVLESYFRHPRYLNVGSIFSVPLKEFAVHLHKSGKYHIVPELHFKVLEMQSHRKEWHPSSGLFVVKDHCDLYSSTALPSYLPPKTNFFSSRNDFESMLPIIPPDLARYKTQLSSFLKPFIRKQQRGNWAVHPMFLLAGIKGSGKMETLKAVSKSFGYHLLIMDCCEFQGVGVHIVEAKLDFVFSKAAKIGPCILVFTNLELLGKDRGNKEDIRVVHCFLQNARKALKWDVYYPLVLMGVTNQKTDNLLPSLRRAFVQTIIFEAPKPKEALSTIYWLALTKGYDLDSEALRSLTNKVPGYIHADLRLLVRHALRIMCEEDAGQLQIGHLEKGIDLMDAAYSDAIGAAEVPSVHWDDVGGLKELKEEVSLTLTLPQQKPGLFSGSLRRSGIMFYGPPGTGKTLMAKAVATECSMNFLSVKGPELMNMYVGQSERNVREVFERAREAAPCILFFDELDSLAPNRGKSGDGGGVTDRVVSQLLSEMDGLDSNKGLFVIAATNRPDLVDPALLRPGRFDKMFYLGPCVEIPAKLSVLQALTKKFTLSTDVSLSSIAEKLPSHVTGADVYSVCSNAWLSAARRSIAHMQKGLAVDLPLPVTAEDFDRGISDLVPSLTAADLSYYQQLSSSTSGK